MFDVEEEDVWLMGLGGADRLFTVRGLGDEIAGRVR